MDPMSISNGKIKPCDKLIEDQGMENNGRSILE